MEDDLQEALIILLRWLGYDVHVWQSSHGPAYKIGDYGYYDTFGRALEEFVREEEWW